jgi:glycosyltransferase involved in cell wall biosynthesis
VRVLWITNILFPPVARKLGLPIEVVGGWMTSAASELAGESGVTLSVATVYPGDDLKCIEIENIIYYLIPTKIKNSKHDFSLEKYWLKIKDEFSPDITHIHGTEYVHGLAYIKACGNDKVIISIQGLVSMISRYYLAGIESKEIYKKLTFWDIVTHSNLFQKKKNLIKRGEIEKEYIKAVKYIIGRTSWDKMHVLTINPTIKYHYCNETLRPSFYGKQWVYDECEKHSIFLSQAGTPIKGLHQLLKALPIILRNYPDTKVYIAGNDFVSAKNWKYYIYRNGYSKYVSHLIKKLDLQKVIYFTGPLAEDKICSQYLKSNVFVCPSSIENSPNSLGEAQLLGVPCIASYVGGVPDMIRNEESGFLYRFEEIEMLANLVCKVFKDIQGNSSISDCEISTASRRHDREINKENLLGIYRSLIHSNNNNTD